MKNLLPTLALLLVPIFNTQAQAPDIQWQKSFGGSGNERVTSVQQTVDSGYIVAGWTESLNGDVLGHHGATDCWVLKLDANGSMQWQKTLGGSSHDIAHAIRVTPDGGYILAGASASSDGDVSGNHGMFDYWVVKLSATGELQWQKSLGGSEPDQANAIQPTADGGYIVAGESASNNGNVSGNHGETDFWVVKLNALGDIQWQKSLGGNVYEVAYAIQQTAGDGYIVTGYSTSNNGNVSGNHGLEDFWVVKLNATGGIEWQKSLGGDNYDVANDIQTTADGGYIVAGTSVSKNGNVTSNFGSFDYWVVKLNSTGGIQWQKSFGGSFNDEAYAIHTTPDGGYIATGYSNSLNGHVSGNHGSTDFWAIKLDAAGNLQWQKSLGGSATDQPYAIQPTLDGGYAVAGFSASNDQDVSDNHGGHDYWVVKLGTDSLLVHNHEKLTDSPFLSVSPNPATDRLTISLQNQQSIHGYALTDLSGREIVRVRLDTGVQKTELNLGDLPKGVHLLQVQSGNRVFCRKLVVH